MKWRDIQDRHAGYAAGKARNFFSRENGVFPKNAVSTGKVMSLVNTARAEKRFLNMVYS